MCKVTEWWVVETGLQARSPKATALTPGFPPPFIPSLDDFPETDKRLVFCNDACKCITYQAEIDHSLGFPGISAGKESAYNTEDPGSIPGSEIFPGEGHCNQLQYSCLKNPHGQSLVSYSPCGLQRVGHDWVTKHTHTSVSPKHVSPFYRVIPALNPCQ